MRLARPAFATECLAFANLPGTLGADTAPEARVPRDRGVDWDFLDVTRHYRDQLFPAHTACVASAANGDEQDAESLGQCERFRQPVADRVR